MSSIDDDDDDELEAKAIADKNYGKGLKRASTRYRKLKSKTVSFRTFFDHILFIDVPPNN